MQTDFTDIEHWIAAVQEQFPTATIDDCSEEEGGVESYAYIQGASENQYVGSYVTVDGETHGIVGTPEEVEDWWNGEYDFEGSALGIGTAIFAVDRKRSQG